MNVARTVVELREMLERKRRPGRTLGFVPTMGALHEGHLSLVRLAGQLDDVVLVSIFVNPLQFGPHEDFGAYPRDIESDLDLLEAEGTDVVFVPSVDEIFRRGALTTISVGPLGQVLEGEDRPGHFDGVCTIVAKLFNLVQPDHAFFGHKDAQQAAVLRRMVTDLNFSVDLVVGPTIRDADGLALSTRNAYLSREARMRALSLWRALEEGRRRLLSGHHIEVVEKTMWDVLASTDAVEPSYARVVDPDTFQTPDSGGSMLLAVAARVAGVRLIDNLLVDLRQPERGDETEGASH